MSQKEIINLLFLPSFSMAKKITDISGRGVGLDVVKSNIEALGGDVEVKTELGAGNDLYRTPAADTCDHPGTHGRDPR